LVGVAVLTRSSGALLIGIACLAGLFQLRWLKVPVLLGLLVLWPALYMGLRVTGAFTRDTLVGSSTELAETNLSLWFRLNNEDLLLERCWEKAGLGWGDTGLALKGGAGSEEDRIINSTWPTVLARFGLVGLTAFYAVLLLPVVGLLRKWRFADLAGAAAAPAVATAAILLLYVADSLFNSFYNPVYFLMAGALMGWAPTATVPELHPLQETIGSERSDVV
jgi:hypothetical protein